MDENLNIQETGTDNQEPKTNNQEPTDETQETAPAGSGEAWEEAETE